MTTKTNNIRKKKGERNVSSKTPKRITKKYEFKATKPSGFTKNHETAI